MMIETLKYLPLPKEANATLAKHFTDLAPPLTERQAAIESARCLYCYDAPCTRICPSEIDVASFIRNIHDGNINGAAAGIARIIVAWLEQIVRVLNHRRQIGAYIASKTQFAQ